LRREKTTQKLFFVYDVEHAVSYHRISTTYQPFDPTLMRFVGSPKWS
jgi:hypothetical protein